MLPRRAFAKKHFEVVGLRTESREAPALIVAPLGLQAQAERFLDVLLAFRCLHPGMASIANSRCQVPMDLSKHTCHGWGQLANQIPPPHYDARSRFRQGLVVAFEKLPRKLAPAEQTISGLQGTIEIQRLSKIASLHGKHGPIEGAPPLRSRGLGQAQIIGTKNHNSRALQGLRIAPNCFSVQSRTLLSNRDLHPKRPIEATQRNASFDLRPLPSPPNQIPDAVCPERSKRDGVVSRFEEVALALSVLSKKNGHALAEREFLLGKVPPAPDSYVS